jgi:hypothetical protein
MNKEELKKEIRHILTQPLSIEYLVEKIMELFDTAIQQAFEEGKKIGRKEEKDNIKNTDNYEADVIYEKGFEEGKKEAIKKLKLKK